MLLSIQIVTNWNEFSDSSEFALSLIYRFTFYLRFDNFEGVFFQEVDSFVGLFGERGVFIFNFFNWDAVWFETSCCCLLAISVWNEVFCSIGPSVVASTMLLSFFPNAMECLAIRVIQNTVAMTLIVLEFANIALTAGPQVRALAILLSLVESSKEDSTIWPLKQTDSVHCVHYKRSLV